MPQRTWSRTRVRVATTALVAVAVVAGAAGATAAPASPGSAPGASAAQPGLPVAPGVAAGPGERGAPEVVLGDDTRQPVAHPRNFPHGAIGLLRPVWSGGHYTSCTGFMVGPHTVLTAAHCLYDAPHGGKPNYVQFQAAKFSTGLYLMQCIAHNHANMLVPQSFIDSPNTGDDLAALEVGSCTDGSGFPNDPIDLTGWMGFAPDDLTGDTVKISGYPDDHEDTMMTGHGPVRRTSSRILNYRIDTTQGQSGSPVFARFDPEGAAPRGWYAIGVHSGGLRSADANWAARIAGGNYNRVVHWFLRDPVQPY